MRTAKKLKISIETNKEKWDKRFLELSKLVSTWSKDPSTKVGAVIVRQDRTILSVGFNGFPKSMKDSPYMYDEREIKLSRIIHGEMNALIHSPEPVRGCTLYTIPLAPCDRCAVHMIQAGITRFVFPRIPDAALERWGDSVAKTKKYIEEAGCSWTEV